MSSWYKLSKTLKYLKTIADKHGIYTPYFKISKKLIIDNFKNHICTDCPKFYSIFELYQKKKKKTSTLNISADTNEHFSNKFTAFPPEPLTQHKINNIIENFCNDTNQSSIIEYGCLICGVKEELMG